MLINFGLQKSTATGRGTIFCAGLRPKLDTRLNNGAQKTEALIPQVSIGLCNFFSLFQLWIVLILSKNVCLGLKGFQLKNWHVAFHFEAQSFKF